MTDAPLVRPTLLSALTLLRSPMLPSRSYSLAGGVMRQYRTLSIHQPRLALVQRRLASVAPPSQSRRSAADWQPVRMIWSGLPAPDLGAIPGSIAPVPAWSPAADLAQSRPVAMRQADAVPEVRPPSAAGSTPVRVSVQRPTVAQSISRQKAANEEAEEDSQWLGSGLVRGSDMWRRLFPEHPGYAEDVLAQKPPAKTAAPRTTAPPVIPDTLPRTRTWEIKPGRPDTPIVARATDVPPARVGPTESKDKPAVGESEPASDDEVEGGAAPAKAGPLPPAPVPAEGEASELPEEERVYPTGEEPETAAQEEQVAQPDWVPPREETTATAPVADLGREPRRIRPEPVPTVSRKAEDAEPEKAEPMPSPPAAPAPVDEEPVVESLAAPQPVEETPSAEPPAAALEAEPTQPPSAKPPAAPVPVEKTPTATAKAEPRPAVSRKADAPPPREEAPAQPPPAEPRAEPRPVEAAPVIEETPKAEVAAEPQRIRAQPPPTVSLMAEATEIGEPAPLQRAEAQAPSPAEPVQEAPAARPPGIARDTAEPRRVRPEPPPSVSRPALPPDVSETGPAQPPPEAPAVPSAIEIEERPVVEEPLRAAPDIRPRRVPVESPPTVSRKPETQPPPPEAPAAPTPAEEKPATVPTTAEMDVVRPRRIRAAPAPSVSRRPEAPETRGPAPAEPTPIEAPAEPALIAEEPPLQPSLGTTDVKPPRVRAVPVPSVSRQPETPETGEVVAAEPTPEEEPVEQAPTAEEQIVRPPSVAPDIVTRRVRTQPAPAVSRQPEAPQVEAPAPVGEEAAAQPPAVAPEVTLRRVRAEPAPRVSRRPEAPEAEAPAPAAEEAEAAAQPAAAAPEVVTPRPVGAEPTQPPPAEPAATSPVVGQAAAPEAAGRALGLVPRRVRAAPTPTLSRQPEAPEIEKEAPPKRMPALSPPVAAPIAAGPAADVPAAGVDTTPRRVRAEPLSTVARKAKVPTAGDVTPSITPSAPRTPPTRPVIHPSRLPLQTPLRPAASQPIVDRQLDLSRAEPEKETLPPLFRLPPAKPAPLPLRLPATPAALQRAEETPSTRESALAETVEVEAAEPEKPDVTKLAREVYDVLKQRLVVEREQFLGF